MHGLAIGIALLVALGIIAIGVRYLTNPMGATRGFGLPLPGESAGVAGWLRLKGVRDIVSGLVVLAVLAWGGPRMVGIVLLVEAMIPVGDMLTILTAKGSTRSAFGIHGLTALVMILASVPLIIEVA